MSAIQTCWALSFGLLLFAPPFARGQAAKSVIKGIVIGAQDNRPIPGAVLVLTGTERRVLSDSIGRFAFEKLVPGTYYLRANAIGFDALTTAVELGERETIDLEVQFGSAPQDRVILPELRVQAQRDSSLDYNADWLRRSQEGNGRYLTRVMIEQKHAFNFADLLRNTAGVRVDCRLTCTVRMARSPANCVPAYFIDGIPADDTVGNLTPPNDIEGVEIYSGPSETPPELESYQARCGVIAIWTRRGKLNRKVSTP